MPLHPQKAPRAGLRTEGGVGLRAFNIVLLMILVAAANALAAETGGKEVAGIALPAAVKVAEIDEPLRLNGAGVRSKFFFKIYVAALYLPQPNASAERILQQLPPSRLLMHFVYDEVSKQKLDDAWEEGFRANLSEPDLSRLRDRLERFKDMFFTLHEGDEVWLDHIPGQGTRVAINGEPRGVIEGADFNRALLSVWLGPNPVTGSLKKALLAAATPL